MEHVDALEVLERAGGQVVDVVEQLADLVAGDQAPEDEVALGAEAHVLLDGHGGRGSHATTVGGDACRGDGQDAPSVV
jgi:hypothetical protein